MLKGETAMKTFRLSLILVVIGTLLIGSVHMTARSAIASAPAANDLSAETLKQLAGARAATARFHDVAQAEAEGYVSINFCEPGEGCHWLKESLLDEVFDPEHPEVLLYVPGSGNSGWRLVAVEYLLPISASPGPPEGFTGDADLWREESEAEGLWELTAWIWLSNPNGMFEQHNPKVP
jgi:hypothetical protein